MVDEGLTKKFIGIYALGISTREIGDYMKEILGSRLPPETVNGIQGIVRDKDMAQSAFGESLYHNMS